MEWSKHREARNPHVVGTALYYDNGSRYTNPHMGSNCIEQHTQECAHTPIWIITDEIEDISIRPVD